MADEEQDRTEVEQVPAQGGEPDATQEDSTASGSGAGSDAARSPDDEPTSETNRAATIESHITRGLLDLGVLTLHFPSRDVALVVDGGAASAALDFFARQRHRPDTSHFVPGVSSMRRGVVQLRRRGHGGLVGTRAAETRGAPGHRPRGRGDCVIRSAALPSRWRRPVGTPGACRRECPDRAGVHDRPRAQRAHRFESPRKASRLCFGARALRETRPAHLRFAARVGRDQRGMRPRPGPAGPRLAQPRRRSERNRAGAPCRVLQADGFEDRPGRAVGRNQDPDGAPRDCLASSSATRVAGAYT